MVSLITILSMRTLLCFQFVFALSVLLLVACTEPSPTSTPTPFATPIAIPTLSAGVEPAAGLTPVLNADNLVRVWHFNNSTKAWTFFDPRSAFSAANTIIQLTAGEVYWINVFSDQTVTLNMRQKVLSAGWNLISW